MLTYALIRSASRQGRFRVLHPNDAVSELAAFTSGAPPSVGGENSPPNGVRLVMKQLRRGAGDRSARVLILTKHRCQGRENFSGCRPRNFSARFLDKTSGREGQFSKSAVPERVYALAGTAIGRAGGAHS